MRLALQYCPYCGEQDLRPREETPETPAGAWECADCRSTFVVTPVPAPARGSA
ncbi:Insertion element protein [Actinomycetospora callitridis]|uniref:Insertion element protein n=1 Tax=Actinomycetospora callitridis TaxID=913944 RepID=UPI002366B422|nr:Insertion element protein [Actinomycetospora callitridis]MDD7919321.1 Insertion element protein [Actinomycetospora callitridis]